MMLMRSRENFSPSNVDPHRLSPSNAGPHRRTDEQLARMADLRFTVGSSDAGFYIGHSRLSSNTLLTIMLQLCGFVIILDSLSGRAPVD